MNQETKDYVSKLILEQSIELPTKETDWLDTAYNIRAAYIMRELCTALDIYTGEEDA